MERWTGLGFVIPEACQAVFAREADHVGPKRRGMRLVHSRPSLAALAVSISVFIASVVVIPTTISRAAPDSSHLPGPRTIYHKGRNFRIPFNLSPDGRDRVKELILFYSEDRGYEWRHASKTFPNQPTFTFRSSHDGEYWFAVQTVTTDGRVSPKLDSTVEPNLKVVVDTFPPTVLLDPDGRRGSQASVRWEVKDENLDLKTLVLEYQAEGAVHGVASRYDKRTRSAPNDGMRVRLRRSRFGRQSRIRRATYPKPRSTYRKGQAACPSLPRMN